MKQPTQLDPYADNILIKKLGSIRSRDEIREELIYLPPLPQLTESLPAHVALHYLADVMDLHLPALEEIRLNETVDLMLRQSYLKRSPASPLTWGHISGEPCMLRKSGRRAYSAVAAGISGSGKTQACLRCLERYRQTNFHENFPMLKDGHTQLVWMSINVPGSGSSVEMAHTLMRETERLLKIDRFAKSCEAQKPYGPRLLQEWQQVAESYFLGILHLDNVENFFKLKSLEKRRKKLRPGELPELSIAEDNSLKWVLDLINSGTIALLVSGTPDGIEALTKRLSFTQRFAATGYHPFRPFETAGAPSFKNLFLNVLGDYQYVPKKLVVDDALAKLVIELTAGIPRLIIALWIAAHRVAFERGKGDLQLSDFQAAARTFLAPVAPALDALRSKDPMRMARYEDLMPKDEAFWNQIWGPL